MSEDRVQHDLPMLRVHRAWSAAEEIAEATGVDRHVALTIARRVIDIIGDGTQRWGHLCTECRSLLVVVDEHLACPEHGPLGAWTGATLLISFDPVTTSDTRLVEREARRGYEV